MQEDVELDNLLTTIDCYLKQNKPLGDMAVMDAQVANTITSSDFARYMEYKQFCLNELSELNQTCGANGALRAAIERGFVLGFYIALQYPKS